MKFMRKLLFVIMVLVILILFEVQATDLTLTTLHPSLVTIPLFLFLFLTTNIIPIVNNNIPYKREIRMKKKRKEEKLE